MRRRRSAIVVSVVVLAALALLATGCGGGEGSPGIASVASSGTTATTSTTTQSGTRSGGKPLRSADGGPSGGQFQIAMNVGTVDGAKFSACMRTHGVKDFPDPSSGGIRLHASSGSDLDPNNPTFQKAQQACRRYMLFK